MKQTVSKRMDGDLNTQQFAVNIGLIGTVQTTLYEYMEGYQFAQILEVQEN